MMDVSVKADGRGALRIPRVPVNGVMLEARAARCQRSIKGESKLGALLCALRMIDLTTLEGGDTPGLVRQLCAWARNPFSPRLAEACRRHPFFAGLERFPSPAAVCVYPDRVPVAVASLAGSGIRVASVATAFPAGRVPIDLRIRDVRYAVDQGADEVDMVIDRGAFLRGDYQQVFDEIARTKEACGERVRLKVILETGELLTYDKIRLASRLAMEAGADFIKTSTGKIGGVATLPITLTMLNAIREYHEETGRAVGMKPAGGLKAAKQAIHYLCMVHEVLGRDWLTPERFRFGASSLLSDILRQVYFVVTGTYADRESIVTEWK
jgi:deoxyribose-phosphate aldolase